MRVVLFVAFWLQVWTAVTGYETGAPAGRCVDMTPGHNVPPQSSPSPYTIVVSNTTFSTNQAIKVRIQGPVYAGLLLQARSGSNTEAVGTWGVPPPNTQHLACSGRDQSAITHSNRNSKNNDTTYTWNPPASLQTAYITATVVSNRTTFWVNLRSAALTGVAGGSNAAADPKMAVTPVLFLTLLMSTVFQ
ncbi:putative defense protein Hdd11 [Pangasianodon hypophthalmus]|uniref:putative defense protein Hdd11 n=1 Tax=Pangasianodon hypophthalmus TaxID=310915 RepID=UPI002307FA4E|nr:putative defense protein Hdd11 [Pangasianodon hypophthalmus]